jgi:trimeric autotransporter adhesin
MAIVNYVGRQRRRAQVNTITIGSSTANQTFPVTYGGIWSVQYQALSTDTTATIAESLLELIRDAGGGFVESAWEIGVADNTIVMTGPFDGAPVAVSVSGGNGTISLSNTTSPLSPFDASDALNYSGNSLPSSGDRLMFEDGDTGPQYNLTALANIPLTYDRRATHTGQVGLPDLNSAGFREYRTTHLSANGTSLLFDENGSEQAGQYRLNWVSTAAVTITHTSQSQGLGDQVLEVKGLPSNSTINLAGGRLALAAGTQETGGASTVRISGGVFVAGMGATLSNITVDAGAVVELRASYTNLTVDGAADVTVRGNAAGTTTTIQGGTVHWASTGNIGTAMVGGGGTLDVSPAPAATPAGSVTLSAEATLNDPYSSLTRPLALILDNCTLQEVTIATGTGGNVTLS